MFSNFFGLLKKKSSIQHNSVSDWSFLKTDIHSHILPGIDDGAQTIEDSIVLIEELRTMGYKSIVTTPHIKYDHYPNNRASIDGALATLQQALSAHNIDMPIRAAAEYYIDDYFLKYLEAGDLLTIRDNEVLVELSFISEPVRFFDILFKIHTAGYKPILAHPERYPFYHDKIDVFKELKNRGCLLQLNTMSLGGYYGKPVKHTAQKLLDEGLYDYCGTDMHHSRHAAYLKGMQQSTVFNQLTAYPFLNKNIL